MAIPLTENFERSGMGGSQKKMADEYCADFCLLLPKTFLTFPLGEITRLADQVGRSQSLKSFVLT